MKTKTAAVLFCTLGLLITSCSTTTTPRTSPSKNMPSEGVTLSDFKLTGDLGGDVAAFTLTANAMVGDAKGGSLELLSGPVALTSLDPKQKWEMTIEQSQPEPVPYNRPATSSNPMQRLASGQYRYVAKFDHGGIYPIEVHFNATVAQSNDWSAVGFRVAPSAVQPVVLQGLAADTEFQFSSAARPEHTGTNFVSYLPVDGLVQFAWKKSRPETEGKLFYAADMVSQITVSPGLMEQAALINGKIMQGEMNKLVLRLHGAGEVTRVQSQDLLSWTNSGTAAGGDREVIVQFNQPKKDSFAILVQMQTQIGAFPQSVDALRLVPEGATRFAGAFRIVNNGAVRLEVTQASGLSQISPDQFPESSLFRAPGSQRFAYRFSSADFALKIQADQILPEVGVSEVLAYHLGENDLSVDAQIELDIREAPLRELLLNIPKGYVVAQPVASGLSDYFTGETADHSGAELRLVYGQPVSGRQVVQIHLERNQSLGETNWSLPRIEVTKAKSVRGFIGVSADNGFRLTTERTQSLTEIATAFFPSQLAGLQTAFRLSDSDWSAMLLVERLPQTVQADVFHLFSIGEGIAYGSSVINYVVSGAPVSAFHVELSDEYFNPAFTGQDIRGWDRTKNGYIVQLNSPVSGAYTLLATYERPFKPKGETLTFTGVRPLDAQSESGHTIIISAYQFDVKPVDVSPGLLELEPGEVPPEYRLFFDQPVLKAYHYSSRPFDLKLALSPLVQGDSLAQVVDRASLTTRISKEGQAITDVRYFVKNRGNPNFRLTLPAEMDLWAATVNGAAVVPVMAGGSDLQSTASSATNSTAGLAQTGGAGVAGSARGNAYLIPLPQHADPDAVLTIDLKLAQRSADATLVSITTPIVAAPVMLAEWKLQPDNGQRLIYRSGTLSPAGITADVSGFAQILALARGDGAVAALEWLAAALFFAVLAIAVWRWAAGKGAHLFGAVIGLAAVFFAAVSLVHLAGLFEPANTATPGDVTLLAPVQQAGSALSVEVANVPANTPTYAFAGSLVLALFAVAFWISGWLRQEKYLSQILGWTFLAWAALRWPNGAPAFLAVIAAFLLLRVLIPSLKQLWSVPPKPKPDIPPPGVLPPPTVVAALLAILLTLGGAMNGRSAGSQVSSPQSVTQQIRIEDKFAMATAKIHWQAEKGQALPLLFEPAVLTHVNYPKSLDLEASPAGSRSAQQLVAQAAGEFDIEVQYQLQVTKRDTDSGFALPVPAGLINRATVTLVNLDVDVFSPQAVSVQRSSTSSNTVATLVLSPGGGWIGWKPRSRDVKGEKTVFVADFLQLYVPSAGVVEGVHRVSIQVPQGELSELIFDVPAGATITDVSDGSAAYAQQAAASQQAIISRPSIVSLWRFDPDARKLRVTLNPAQSRPFSLVIRSQVATGTLPFEQRVGLISVEGAASQNGLLGVATGNEVQLDSVAVENFSAINLEDFSAATAQPLAAQFPGLTVRRAFSYSGTQATATLKAAAVEPDVRVITQDTLSLGEDRTVLATTADVTILRAGIFKLSFVMPAGYDVESISGPALSHWTELKTDAGRVITLNLNGRTEGRQQFTISLSGPGVKTATNWLAPQVVLREAGKQSGTLLVVPEQGMHLQAVTLEGVMAGDPQTFGVRQKGVLAFNIRETPWKLALDIKQGDPWIQVTSLEHATVNEAQMKVAANLQYQIENAGVKAFHVLIPTNAEGVTFQGDQLVDFIALDGAMTNGLQTWEIKLQRRVIGQYMLQVKYQTSIADLSGEAVLRGVQAADVNSQRGFVTLESSGRLQVRVDNLPASLQPTEWQAIPIALQKDMPAVAASFSYRLVEADFQLPLKLERHEAAKLLPAHINNITFTSVISDAGVMLTHVRLEILPGDKRLLHLTLPAGTNTHFWFAFVNQNGVWPWREQNEILIPLEQQSRGGQPEPVELFFSSEVGKAAGGSLDLNLLAPKFDLPLENLTWRVFLNDKWQVKKWNGALQLQQQEVVSGGGALDMQSYLQAESSWQQQKTREAQQMLALGNSALQNGDPQQARRAFESAKDLSRNDAAFNEDARVQLNNLKLQQALVGLNVRQASVGNANGSVGGMGGALNELRNNKDANYTQQEAKQIIDNGSAEQNAALMNLADKLVKQQESAVMTPAVIRANIPEQGRLLTFKRAVVVDPWADLNIGLEARSASTGWWKIRLLVMAVTALVLAGFILLTRALVKSRRA